MLPEYLERWLQRNDDELLYNTEGPRDYQGNILPPESHGPCVGMPLLDGLISYWQLSEDETR